jgi:hypothetical protein
MVKLVNIKLHDGVIECDIYPEDSKEPGHISVNTGFGQTESYRLPAGYEDCLNHVSHARTGLMQIYCSGPPIPASRTVMWY